MTVREYPTFVRRSASRPQILDVPTEATLPHHLETDDLYILNPNFHGYVSVRDPEKGSMFCKAIALAVSRHGCHKEITTLFEEEVIICSHKLVRFGVPWHTNGPRLARPLEIWPM